MDREGQNGRRGVPQAGGELQPRHRPEAGPHQRRPAVQAGARRPHKGRPEGGAALKEHRPRQYRPQQQMNPRLGQQCQHRGDGSGPLGRFCLGSQAV